MLNQEFNESPVSASQVAAYLANCPAHEKTVVAELDGELAGFACVQIYQSWCYPRPWAELTELYVRPQHRRRGLGRAMLMLAEQLARDADAAEIVLLTGQSNSAAQSLYEGCGYARQARSSFSKDLSAADQT
jgi:ribosomal protein S18 acetylase RimI-like enzyme